MVTDALIFDLDGTLWDAAAASAYGWNLSLEEMGLPQRLGVDDIRSVSGHPFIRCVEILLPELHPVPDGFVAAIESGERAGIDKLAGELYAGVPEGLARLSSTYPLFLVSNCPDWYLEQFLHFSGVGACFAATDCHGRSGASKPEMLLEMVQKFALKRPIYVGDTQGDRDAAEAAGMDFAFASYGFGSTDEAGLSFATFTELVEHFATPPRG